MSKTLLLISIGPVQDFIASARKLRDLWFGSYLLSEMSKTVARYLSGHKAQLIFPYNENNEALKEHSGFSVANKIIAEVDSPEMAERLQNGAREEWKKKIATIGTCTVNWIVSNYNDKKNLNINNDRFEKECTDYGEFYAVWADIASAGGYMSAWKRVHDLMTARKRVRLFTAPSWNGAGLRKNSLDGMRETVFTAWEIKEIPGILKKNERLDAMGCIKRFHSFIFKKENKRYFDDLADIALVPWLKGVIKDADRENLKQFQEKVINADKDLRRKNPYRISNNKLVEQPILSELYFSIKKDIEERVGTTNIEIIMKARDKLFKAYREPYPYAMILHGDGDRTRDFINTIQRAEDHRKVADKLSSFAQEAEDVVKDNEGSLIYAGGDDVMAILPLHTGIKCADKLRTAFNECLRNLVAELHMDAAVSIPTFSAGIAIVHYLEPLDQALKLSRSAEKVAKDNGRNSLAVIQSKRSGPDVKICGKWDDDGALPGIPSRMSNIVKLYKNPDKVLPTRLGYQLREIALSAGDKMSFSVDADKIIPTNPAAAMVKRLFVHKNDGDKEKERQLMPILHGRTSVRALADELVIGRQIADAELMAEGKERQ